MKISVAIFESNQLKRGTCFEDALFSLRQEDRSIGHGIASIRVIML